MASACESGPDPSARDERRLGVWLAGWLVVVGSSADDRRLEKRSLRSDDGEPEPQPAAGEAPPPSSDEAVE